MSDFSVVTDRDSWLKLGQERGWIGPAFCYVHELLALTDEEQVEVENEDGDLDVICVTVARLP